MIKALQQLAIKNESVKGTAEALAGADVILAHNLKFTPHIEPNKRNPAKSTLGRDSAVPGDRWGEISFDVYKVGAAAAGGSVHYVDALKACGLSETLVALTSNTQLPDDTVLDTATIAIYENGKIYKIWGARGNVKEVYETGKPAVMSFTFSGCDFSVTDGAMLSAGIAYETTMPPAFQDASLTIGGYAATIAKLEIDLGNKVVVPKDANQASGRRYAEIVDREPTLSFDPEEVLVAANDFFGQWRSGVEAAFTATIGATAGNTIEVTAPKVQFIEVSPEDREGISALGIKAQLNRNAGNDEYQTQIT